MQIGVVHALLKYRVKMSCAVVGQNNIKINSIYIIENNV